VQTEGVPETVLRRAVAEAARLRRRRDFLRELAYLAPRAAVVCFVGAVAIRLAGGPNLVLVLVVVLGLLTAAAVSHRRARPAGDPAAKADADAGLGGELRSAHWFVSAGTHDAWASYHVAQAAERTSTVQWPALYPREPRRRAWLTAIALSAASLMVSLVVPPLDRLPFQPTREVLADSELTPEQLAQLEAWLASLDPEDLMAADGALDEALGNQLEIDLSDLSPELREKLEELARSAEGRAALERSAADAPEAGEPVTNREDLDWATDEAAARQANADAAATDLSEAGVEQQAQNGEESAEAAAGGTSSSEPPSESGRLSAREAAGEASASQFIQAEGGPPGGDSGPGDPNLANAPAGQAAEAIAVALREERVRAHADATGDTNPDAATRRTGQADSALVFEGGSVPVAGRSRSVGAPPPPDGRRPLVFDFFTRP